MSAIPHVVLYAILLLCELGEPCNARNVDVFEAGELTHRLELVATDDAVLVRASLPDDALATIERSRHVAHLYVFHSDSPTIVDLASVFSTLVRSRDEIRVQGGDFPGEWIVRTESSEGSESSVMYVSNGAVGIVAVAR
ncbi:MAG: hypothetical protein EA426_06325 [Spirochaetaceae bacterium]|nr:MAG: hypothetical protein EA426_06325 [Spirochaetaceae bacterium]